MTSTTRSRGKRKAWLAVGIAAAALFSTQALVGQAAGKQQSSQSQQVKVNVQSPVKAATKAATKAAKVAKQTAVKTAVATVSATPAADYRNMGYSQLSAAAAK